MKLDESVGLSSGLASDNTQRHVRIRGDELSACHLGAVCSVRET